MLQWMKNTVYALFVIVMFFLAGHVSAKENISVYPAVKPEDRREVEEQCKLQVRRMYEFEDIQIRDVSSAIHEIAQRSERKMYENLNAIPRMYGVWVGFKVHGKSKLMHCQFAKDKVGRFITMKAKPMSP